MGINMILLKDNTNEFSSCALRVYETGAKKLVIPIFAINKIKIGKKRIPTAEIFFFTLIMKSNP